jgi:hypothetical protein
MNRWLTRLVKILRIFSTGRRALVREARAVYSRETKG